MSVVYKVPLRKIIDKLSLEVVYDTGTLDEIFISSMDLNRPGLPLAGFFEHFDNERIQIIGKTEMSFLESAGPKYSAETISEMFSYHPPMLIVTRNIKVENYFIDAASEYKVPILRTNGNTSSFMTDLQAMLNVELAPRVTRHGVLVEVYGEGVLLLGESGIGKSETAIELTKRGHRLVADDAVEIRRVSNHTLVGSSPENIRHFLELRGVGVVNARRLFGISAVKPTEKINMIIHMEQWDQDKVYERLGQDSEYSDILGIKIPSITIPVKPGRNLAIIIEVAAMNNRLKKMGYDPAQELMQRLGLTDDVDQTIDYDSVY